MASQQGPPSRPWFRLATMARPPPATPTPQPQPDQRPPPPRPTLMRPAFTQAAQAPPPPQPTITPPVAPLPNVVPPQPPVARPPAPAPPSPSTLPKEPRPLPPSSNPRSTPPLQQSVPPSSVATSPPPPPPQPSRSTPRSLAATTAPTINRAATPTSSPPKTVKPLEKTSPPSPNIKPLSRPPSPLALPSPQLKSYHAPEYDQKSVLVQETKEKPKGLNNGHLRRHMAPDTHPKKPEASKKHLDSEDLGMRIITIAGENKGAIMDLTPFGNKTHKYGSNPQSLHMKKDNPTASSDGDKSGTNSDGKSKAKKKNQKSNSPLMSAAVMNSNVQGVNNSILYNCSTTHHDPGIHLSLSRKPSSGRGISLKDQKDHIV